MQAKAVRFLHDVVGDDYRADEFEEMSPEKYADHKGIQIVGNPSRMRIQKRSSVMARAKTPPEPREEMAGLKAQIRVLEDENSDLQEQVEDLENRLDEIGELACAEDEEQEEPSEGQE